MANKDDELRIDGVVGLTVDQASAKAMEGHLRRIIGDLEKHPIKIPFDTSIFREYQKALTDLADKQKSILGGRKKDELASAQQAELAMINNQIKALTKLRDVSAQLNRDQQAYSTKRQALVGQYGAMSDSELLAIANSKGGGKKVGQARAAAVAQAQLATSQGKLAQALLDNGFKEASIYMTQVAEQMKASAGAVGKRLQPAALAGLKGSIAKASKAASDAVVNSAAQAAAAAEKEVQQQAALDAKEAIKRNQAYLREQRALQQRQGTINRNARGKIAYELAGGTKNFDPDYMLRQPPSERKAVVSYLNSEVKANENIPQQMKLYQRSLDQLTDVQAKRATQLKQMTAAEKQGEAEQKKLNDALARHAAGEKAFNRAGGVDNFNPALLTSKSEQKRVGGFLGSEVDRLTRNGASAEEIGKIQTAQDKLTNSMQKFKGVGAQAGQVLKNFFKYALGYGALYQVLGAVTALGRGILELDTKLYEIQAISQSTTKEMLTLSGAINEIAISTKFSTNEIADAAKTLSQAGLSAKELPEALRAVANFGAATGADLQVAADILTTMQEVYKGLSSDQAANELTKAVNVSKLTTEDLKVIISTGAQITASYGVTSEQLLAAAATLRNAGIKASTIATGLSQATLEVFTLDANSVKGLLQQYHKLGEDMSEEQVKGLYAGFTQAKDPLLAVATELKRIGFGSDESLNRIFDKRATNPLLALISRLEEYRNVQGGLNFGQPAAEGAAKAMGSLSAQVDNLGSAMTALGQQITGGPVSSLKDLVQWATKAIETLRQVDVERKAKGQGGIGDIAESYVKGAVAGGPVGALLNSAKTYLFGRDKGSAEEEVARGQETVQALQVLADQASEAVTELKNARAAFDPDAQGEHTLGESIHQIADGLKGTDEQVQIAKNSLAGVAKSINDQVVQLADAIQTGGPEASAKAQETFAKIKEAVPQMFDIIRGVGEYADPTKQLQGLEDIARAMRDASGGLTAISEQQSKAADAAKKVIDQEVKNILSETDSTKMSSAVQAFLLTVDQLGVAAATERLKILRQAIETALKGATDPAQIANLQAQLGNIDTAIGINNAQGLKEKTSLAGSISTADLQDPTKVQAYLNSPAGQQLLPGVRTALQDGSAVAGAQALQSNPGSGLKYDASGKLVSGLPYTNPQEITTSIGSEAALGFAKYQQDEKARIKPDQPDVTPSTHEYIPDSGTSAKIGQLDFDIEKIKEFGGAAGELVGLVQQKNALLLEEQQKAVKVAQDNANATGGEKEKKALAEEQIKLQKLELEGRKDYIDAVTKDTDAELKTYQDRAKTILEQGGDLNSLDAEFKAKQQEAIQAITDWGHSVGMSDDRIKAEIESRGILTQSLLSDKAVDERLKTFDRTVASLQKAVPTNPTSGNAVLDAQSRVRGYGFTNAEMSNLYASQITGNQNVISGEQNRIANMEQLIPFSSPEKQEQMRAAIEAAKKNIEDLTDKVADLNVEMQDIGTTGAEQLNQAFGKESIRPYLTALEQSQFALKNWGASLRGEVLTAWESIGGAIADAVVNGENFNDLMRKVLKDFAGNVLRTSINTTLNSIGRNVLGAIMPSTQEQAGQPSASGQAAPAAGGFLSSVASTLGLGPSATPGAAGTSVAGMTVNAGTVTIIGGEKAMSEAADKMMGGKDGKGVFSSLLDTVKGWGNAIGDTASSLWKGASSGASGLASDAGSWISSLFAAKGWVGHYSSGYVDRSGIIRGPGNGTSDSVPGIMKFAKGYKPIMVSNKESILTAKATQYLGADTIRGLNSGSVAGFSSGRVSQSAGTGAVNREAMRPIVNVPQGPAPQVHIHNGIDEKGITAAGLENNPAATRAVFNIIRKNKREFNALSGN